MSESTHRINEEAKGLKVSSEEIQSMFQELKDLTSKLQIIVDPLGTKPQAIIEQIKSDYKTTELVGEIVRENLSKRMELDSEYKAIALKAFRKFEPTKINTMIRKNMSTFVEKGELIGDFQAKVIQEDLEAFASLPPKNGIRLFLSEDELSSLNIEPNTGEVSSSTVKSLFGKLDQFAVDLFRAQYNLSICKATVQAEEMMKEIIDSKANDSSSQVEKGEEANPSTFSSSERKQLVMDQVALQMKLVNSPENNVVFGVKPRPTQKDIQEATDSFELRGGPADVTAYHDFHDLQIAFRHVWTELFDEELTSLGQKLYAELVKLKKENGVPIKVDDEPITSVEELHELLEELKQTQLAIAENDGRFKKVREMLPEVTIENWVKLDETTKKNLFDLANQYTGVDPIKLGTSAITLANQNNPIAQSLLDKARVLYKENVNSIKLPTKKKSRVENFLEDLELHLREKYAFNIFSPNSVNYGILVTYRQEWKPLKYQVGELVSTIPLMPKEVRKYTMRKIVKKTRAEKEIENSLRIRKEESAYTSRDHAEIMSKAENKTNFKHNAEGGVNFLVWNAKGSHGIEIDSAQHSSQIKKEMREAVIKAAQEYKNEHRLEIDTAITEEVETTMTAEISNPNDELPVTFLLYELERCYEIREKIHKLTPVIMVANDMPSPGEIDEDWLLRHDWILKRVLLDDSYKQALDYLKEGFTEDEISIEVLRHQWETHLNVVEKIGRNVVSGENASSAVRQAMDKAIEKYSASLVEESEGLFGSVWDFFAGGDTNDTEMQRVRMEAAKEAFQRSERDLQELRSQLAREVSALEEATEKYTNALKSRFARRTEILRLRAHVKDNILYYMQAIWDQEPSDQRFFRLYDQVVVPVFDLTDFQYKVSNVPVFMINPAGTKTISLKIIAPRQINIKYKKLVEVADLDNPLGYKGNYTIFSLKEGNAITTFMMQDYIEAEEFVRLRDPDEFGQYSVEELRQLIKCILKQDPEILNDDFKEKLKSTLIRKLSDPYPEKETIIVPTNSLYIEALPGKHPILEDFKLIHRAVDVKKVQSEVRHGELENVRLAARILEGEYEAADIEKKIVIERNSKT